MNKEKQNRKEQSVLRRLSGQTYRFLNPPRIVGQYSVVGRREGEGPLENYFDKIIEDPSFGEQTYEKAEKKMMLTAIEGAIDNAGLKPTDVDALLGGDLLNQIVTINYAARAFDIGFLGIYGACSNMAETLLIGSMIIDGGFSNTLACATGSHFASAERQYRGPMELGSQRAPYSQWTVTGTACSVISNKGVGPRITEATIGKVCDYGITDSANMGAAMAPAAVKTIAAHLEATKTTADDYDLIITGDLSKLGSDIVRQMMKKEHGIELGTNYNDCGNLIYYLDQKTCQGGSGCGCSAVVLNGYLIAKLKSREYRRVMLVGTGALMSTTVSQQGETIPGIAHAVVIES